MDYKSLEMELVRFENANQLEQQLAKKIAYDLEMAMHKNGYANILVSGGSTPLNLFKKLADLAISWEHVTIGLVDERWVEQTSPFSNELLVKSNLLQNKASKANFIGMVFDTTNEATNLQKANEAYLYFIQKGVDSAILGMGDDGHTASLFPNDEASENDLKGENTRCLISTKAPNNPQHRISCNKNLLLKSTHLYLMILGAQKLEVFEKANEQHYPISYFSTSPHFITYYSEQK